LAAVNVDPDDLPNSPEVGGQLVDPEDLLNAREVAEELGLAHREAIATYRRRYEDFPEPRIVKGTCVLWWRPEIREWDRRRKRHRPASDDPQGGAHA
jgi:predicted DNA-binding transcriptional regulator AlpA